MSLSRRQGLLGLWALLVVLPALPAQPPTPRIGYVFPAGGRQGTTFQVLIGGRFLDGADKLIVSGNGIQAKVIQSNKPLTPRQVNELKEKLRQLQEKRKDPSILKEIAEIRMKIAAFVRRAANPVLAETVTLQVTLASDAEPGQRELRLGATTGLSNPLAFHVGQLPEYCEKEEPKNRPLPGATKPLPKPLGLKSSPPEQTMNITLPAIVNGQIMPGDVDRYRFQARQGQHLVIAAQARALIPYLADAVPGWFQATLTLFDAKGNELAYDDHYRFHPDPVLLFKIPSDGAYVLEVKDALYRGREDFVYRIALGELPFVTSIFPLGGPRDRQTTVAIEGWNLPVASITVANHDKNQGPLQLVVGSEGQFSNRVPFLVDSLPECREQEPNNQPASAQRVTLPIVVNGRIDPPGDIDVFQFSGRAGEEIVAEVYARRLESPLDSVLRLADEAGRQLAFNDDHEDKGSGLHTHHADSLLRATLPADGTYYLHLGDAQRQGGSAYGYRLRISAPQPDFELRVVPASINARPGTATPITVYALRKDGFVQEISLALKNAPKGFTLSGARIPPNQDQVRLTLTVPSDSLKNPVNLLLEGRARIQGREIRRLAVPAEDMMQAFIYHHLVPAQNLMVGVTGQGRVQAPLKLMVEDPVKIPTGGTASVRFAFPRGPLLNRVQLVLNEPPDGITIQKMTPNREGATLFLHAEAGKAKPGLQGNLIVDVFLDRVLEAKPGKPRINQRRQPVATLPAIPFEIVGQAKRP